ncbi:hypothetical protein [Lacinutrix jangbogonensis]|uniref:hypothetical protein n=1 Tax=Lacinutrix jangbogonensis TaxID=1469557 RepID=UPI00053D8632|nr:hypothetical protein [Lacinutrix jangbogonensis]
MRHIVSLLVLLFSILCFSQEEKKERIYEFDYFLEYSSTGGEGGEGTRKHYKVINSKDNSYSIAISDLTEDSLSVFFNDFENIYANGKILKSDFVKPDTLDFKCGYKTHIRDNLHTTLRKNQYKFKLNYHKLKDTVVNDKAAVKYAVISERKLKRGKIDVEEFLVIEKNKDFKKPNFNNYFHLEQWNNSNIKIEGVVVYKIHKMKSNKYKLKDWEVKLVNYSKFKKVLKVNLDCN